MSRFSLPGTALLMSYKVSQREVEKIVDKLDITPAEELDIPDAQEVRVAAVQLLLRRYSSLAEYIADMNHYVADAVNRRAQIICFPQFAGLLPASFLPQSPQMLLSLRPQIDSGLPDPAIFGECLSYFSDVLFDAYSFTMAALAERHCICIMAGSTLYFAGQNLRHRAFLYGRRGELLGYQDKLGLTAFEQSVGIEPENEVKAFSTPVGTVVMLIGSDGDYFEPARTAVSLGARILLHPAAFASEYTSVRAALGINMRAQENLLWAVQSTIVGDTGLGFVAEGPAAAFGPVALSRTQNGTIARTRGGFEGEVLCASLNMERLAELKNPYLQDRNPQFLEKYIDRLL